MEIQQTQKETEKLPDESTVVTEKTRKRSQRSAEAEIALIRSGALVVNPGTWMEGKVADETAVRLGRALTDWLKNARDLAMKHWPSEDRKLPAFVGTDKRISNNFVQTVAAFRRAKGLPDGSDVDKDVIKLLLPDKKEGESAKAPAASGSFPLLSAGFQPLGKSGFHQNRGAVVALRNGRLSVYTSYPNAAVTDPLEIKNIAVREEKGGDKLYTRGSSGYTRGYNPQGLGGIVEKEKEGDIGFQSGSLVDQLRAAGFRESGDAPGVFSRTLRGERRGESFLIDVTAIVNRERISALIVEAGEIAAGEGSKIRQVGKGSSSRSTWIVESPAGPSAEIATSRGITTVKQLNGANSVR